MAAPLEMSHATVKLSRLILRLSLDSHARTSVSCINKIRNASTVSTVPTSTASPVSPVGNAGAEKAQRISQAMRAYLERAREHDQFMQGEIAEYEIGKRHLANMMGSDPDTLSQEEIDKAVEYLLPSGLFDKKARPQMRHPTEVIPKRKAAQFGMDGRPFHYLFYTGTPNYFQIMQIAAQKVEQLKEKEDTILATGASCDKDKQLHLAGSEWIKKEILEDKLQEKISDLQYVRFTKLMEWLAAQPLSMEESEFVMSYRREIGTQKMLQEIPPLLYDDNGVAYQDGQGSRKTSLATARVRAKGTGIVTINGKDLFSYFWNISEREQIMFPLQFTGLLGEVDLEAAVQEGGSSSQAGAIRLATAVALQSFVEKDMVENMRLAGLLTWDPRNRERKKPGQWGARRKFTWKKR